MSDQAKYVVTLEFQTSGADKELNNLRELQRGIDGATRSGGLNDKTSRDLSKTNHRLSESFGGVGNSAQQSEDSIISLRYANYDLSRSLLAVSAGITAAGIGMAAASASYESAFTSVERTSGVAGAAVEELRGEFLQLAREIPQTFSELSDLGARGAQLGIATDQLSAFTETVAQFVATSDTVTLDQAVEGFGRISNLLGDTDFNRIGSAISMVGVNAAATEGQIVKTAQELAPFATAAGMTTDEVIGLAAALGSLGQPPERARSAFLTLQRVMDTAIASGSENLQSFANLLGMTANETAALWKQDPGAFVEAFATSLGSVEDLTSAFASLGINERRAVQVFQALAADARNAGGGLSVLNKAMADSERGYQENTEMARQFSLIQDDLASKWQILLNHLMELVVAAGDHFLPTLKAMMDGITGLTAGITAFIDSPIGGFLARLASTLAGLVAAWAAVRGVIALTTASTLAFSFAARSLGGIGIVAGLQGLRKAMLGVRGGANGAAGGVLTLSGALRTLVKATIIGSVIQVIASILFDIPGAAVNAGNAVLWLSNQLGNAAQMLASFLNLIGITTSAEALVGGIRDVGNAMVDWGKANQSASASAKGLGGDVGDLNDILGDLDVAAQDSAESLGGGGGGGGGSVAGAANKASKEVRTLTDYVGDLQGLLARTFEIRLGIGQSQDSITKTFHDLRNAAAAAAQRVKDLRQEIRNMTADISGMQADIGVQEYFLSIALEYGDTQRATAIQANLLKLQEDLASKQMEMKKTQSDLTAEQEKNNKTLKGNSEQAVLNRAAIRGLVSQYQAQILALAASGVTGEALRKKTAQLRSEFIAQATQLGFNREEVTKFAATFLDASEVIKAVPPVTIDVSGLTPAQIAIAEFVARANQELDKVGNNFPSSMGAAGLAGANAFDNNFKPEPKKEVDRAGKKAQQATKSPFSSAGNEASNSMLRRFGTDAKTGLPTAARPAFNALKLFSSPQGIAVGAVVARSLKSGMSSTLDFLLGGRNSKARKTVRGAIGFQSGGFTGRGSPSTPAGIVHAGEYVVPQNQVNQSTGLPNADALGRLMGGITSQGRAPQSSGSGVSGPQAVSLTAGTIQAIAQATGKNIFLNGKLIADSSSESYSRDNVLGAN